MTIREEKNQYIVLFKGDDSDFVGNQQILLKLETELDLTGCKAHFRFLDFKQDFDEIPADKTLKLVFPKAQTAKFPLGAMDAELWLEDSTGKRRTVANRIHVVVTNSVKQAYDNDDPQAITVVITTGSVESISWNNITGKPSTFPPSAHTHPISQVVGLQEELNLKVNKIQNATAGSLASLTSDGGIQNSGESITSLKEYTNTQVATNTANFLGTYDYATDLGFTPPATSADVDNAAIAAALPSHVEGTPTNNDYVFVVINYTATIPADEFRRFKYNATDSAWFYEYTLNSASFTPAQWAAINSGITGVVAPSSSATTGQAASAKATGDALTARPTKSQIDEGWWSDWSGLPTGVFLRVSRWSDSEWSCELVDSEGELLVPTWHITSAVEPEIVQVNYDGSSFTATRHRVAAPVPTKTSDLTNNGAPNGGGSPYSSMSDLPYALAVPADGTAAKTLQLADRTVGVITAAKINPHYGQWEWKNSSGQPIVFSGDVPQPTWDDELEVWTLTTDDEDALYVALFGVPVSAFSGAGVMFDAGETATTLTCYVNIYDDIQVTLRSIDWNNDTCVVTVNNVDINGRVVSSGADPYDYAVIKFPYNGLEYTCENTMESFQPGSELYAYCYTDIEVSCSKDVDQDYTAAVLPPPRADGKPRDFVVNLELETVDGNLAEFDFVPSTGETLSFATKDGNFPAPQEGKNLYYFTEVEAHVLMVKAETVEVVGA